MHFDFFGTELSRFFVVKFLCISLHFGHTNHHYIWLYISDDRKRSSVDKWYFSLSVDEWSKIEVVETKYNASLRKHASIFSEKISETNKYCVLRFNYNRVRKLDSRKSRAPFFRDKLEIAWNMKSLKKRILVQINMSKLKLKQEENKIMMDRLSAATLLDIREIKCQMNVEVQLKFTTKI